MDVVWGECIDSGGGVIHSGDGVVAVGQQDVLCVRGTVTGERTVTF